MMGVTGWMDGWITEKFTQAVLTKAKDRTVTCCRNRIRRGQCQYYALVINYVALTFACTGRGIIALARSPAAPAGYNAFARSCCVSPH